MDKKVLIIGKGGREHALVDILSKSKVVEKIYISPGNGGTSEKAKNISINLKYPFREVIDFVKNKHIDMVVVGPEEYLVNGITDELEKENISVFGPSKGAACLEGSKIFAKKMMEEANVSTAKYVVVNNKKEALDFIEKNTLPLIFKADGLAEGKGVMVCESRDDVENALKVYFEDRKFGDAGNEVLIETFLKGFEASLFVITDGLDYRLMPFSQDHKRAFDGDEGPNTGGMGVYSPVKKLDNRHKEIAKEKIIEPMLKVMRKNNIPYRGVLYIGLMIDGLEMNVVEFNCRFGDPEAECLLPLIKSDFYNLMDSCINGKLKDTYIEIEQKSSCAVVLASKGYPDSYKKGEVIHYDNMGDVNVFHCGTKVEGEKIVSDGGRVMCVSAQEKTLQSAINKAYESIKKIEMKNSFYRKDIGHKGL